MTEDISVLLNNDVNLNNFLDDASCFTLSAVIHRSHSRMLMALDTKVCSYYAQLQLLITMYYSYYVLLLITVYYSCYVL
jgi:hypothetical protein